MKVNSCQTCFCRFNIPYNISVAVRDHFMMFLKHDLLLKMTAKKRVQKGLQRNMYITSPSVYVIQIKHCMTVSKLGLQSLELLCSFPCISPNTDWLFKLPEIRLLSLSPTSLFIFLKIWQIVPLKWILKLFSYLCKQVCFAFIISMLPF